jgi:carbon-monoxide dehydrogenase iron sulfur subunit
MRACRDEHKGHQQDYASIQELPLSKKPAEDTFSFDLLNPVPFAIRCQHCPDAPCVASCISGSMQQSEENGRVFNDLDLCVGCWMCVMACPYCALIPLVEERKVLKCDQCLLIEQPACVWACPTNALIFSSRDEYEGLKRKMARWNDDGKRPAKRLFE